MKAPVLIAISAAACLGLAILCGGAAPFGRLALAVGHGQRDAVLQQAHTAHAELGAGAEAAG